MFTPAFAIRALRVTILKEFLPCILFHVGKNKKKMYKYIYIKKWIGNFEKNRKGTPSSSLVEGIETLKWGIELELFQLFSNLAGFQLFLKKNIKPNNSTSDMSLSP